MCRNHDCKNKAHSGKLCGECTIAKEYYLTLLKLRGITLMLPKKRRQKVHKYAQMSVSLVDRRED